MAGPTFTSGIASPSSNAKHLLVNGVAKVMGKTAASAALNSAASAGSESFCEQSAIPITASGKEERRSREKDWCHAEGGCVV